MLPTGTGSGRGRQRGGQSRGHSQSAKPFTKRARENSSEYEDVEDDDPETIVDALVGALHNPEVMTKFVECICASKVLVNSLTSHLIPNLKDSLQLVLQPLQNSIENLTEQLKKSEQRCIDLESKNDDLEQYTRRQNLRISGIPENAGENTDDLVLDFFTKTMKVEVDMNEIDRSHRVGRPGSKFTRDLIVRFTSWKSRQKIMKTRKAVYEHNKRHKTSYYVFEDLTKNRSILAYHARQLKKSREIKDTWTSDGKIFIKHHNDKIDLCTRLNDLPNKPPGTSTQRKTYASAAKEPRTLR